MHDNTNKSQNKSSATPVAQRVCAHHGGVAQSEVSQSAPVGYPQSQPALEKKKKKNLGNFQKLSETFRKFQKLSEISGIGQVWPITVWNCQELSVILQNIVKQSY